MPPVGSASSRQQSSPARRLAGVVVAALAVAFVGWLGYEWLRPLSPREVCERLDNARTAEEARRYCTLNFQPVIEAMHRQRTPESNDDKFEYTQEGEAPPEVGGYFVGVRWQGYIAEERRRMQLDGVIHLIKSEGWKVEDMYFLSVDRQPTPQPVSLADLLLNRQAGNGQLAEASRRAGPATATSTQAKAWYENRGVQQATARGIGHFLTTGGGKALGAILCAALVGVLRFGREIFSLVASLFTGQQGQGS